MSKNEQKTVVSGPPESPVALLDQLRNALENPTGRSTESVSDFLINRLANAEALPPELAAADLEKQKKGPYEIGNIVAQGGMGAIVSAIDSNLRRTVALKVILSGNNAADEHVQRLITEARITGQLEHPNIVPLYELGVTRSGVVYYTMRMVEGPTLSTVLDRLRGNSDEIVKRFGLAKLLTIFQKVCDAVAFAHSRGVVHRDLKPDNVMIGEFGEVMVMDWGLAKVLNATEESDSDSDSEFLDRDDVRIIHDDTYQTIVGRVKGTPRYMAPEQAQGLTEEIDERTDIYALGAMLYSILTLHPPVAGDSVNEVLKRVATGSISPPTHYNHRPTAFVTPLSGFDPENITPPSLDHCPNRRIPASLSAVTMKALGRKKVTRYQSVADLQRDIGAYQTGFATSAEDATALTMFWLLLKRKRTEATLIFTAIFAMVVIATWFTSRVTSVLNELKQAAPSFYTESRTLVGEVKFAKALSRINYALSLMPNEPRFHALKGNIHQSLSQFREAHQAYLSAQKLDPDLPHLFKNIEISKNLLNEKRRRGVVSPASLVALRATMQQQLRVAETLAVTTQLNRDTEQAFQSWKALLDRAQMQAELSRSGRRSLSLKINNPEINDLAPLSGMPLQRLDASGTETEDLAALKGMPLAQLNLSRTRIRNLAPLGGLKLKELDLSHTEAATFGDLSRLPLETLNLAHTAIDDLSPLRDLPLRELRLDGCTNLSNLEILLNCQDLERLTVPAGIAIPAGFTNLSKLRQLGTNWSTAGWPDVPAYEKSSPSTNE
ncbi:MAG: serine/threonine protein kinase [Limisphaerales bacterium]|jgi:serine/threonine protein kinase